MELTKKQEEGLKIAVDRYRKKEKYTVIAGYAGTGKSTLVRYIVDALQVDYSKVCYATYTGKAAEVLRKKGNKNAFTLHKLLYIHHMTPNGKYIRVPKPSIDYKIVIVDEISMVPNDLVKLLFSHDCYIICLGDPFQLPPIIPETDNHLLDQPHVFLDQIMRQAEDSEIIRLSLQIREYKPINLFNGKEVKIISKKDLTTGTLLWADQILVATNQERIKYNNCVRNLLGIENSLPQEGDKVICLCNYWDDISDTENPLVNGTIGYLKHLKNDRIYLPHFIASSTYYFDIITTDIHTDDGKYYNLNLDKLMLSTGEASYDKKTAYLLNKFRKNGPDLIPKQFSYGYAITVHKSQGSQWDKVLVAEEKFPFEKTEHARWLYTAVTRAAERLVLIKQ